MPEKRPYGVTLLSAVFLALAATYSVLFVLSIVNLSALIRFADVAPNVWNLSRHFSRNAAQDYRLVYGVLTPMAAIVGIGFWRLWNWTRIAISFWIVFSLWSVLTLKSLHVFDAGISAENTMFVANTVVSLAVLAYLFTPQVRRAFGARRNL
jgi:hypothetical protein